MLLRIIGECIENFANQVGKLIGEWLGGGLRIILLVTMCAALACFH